MRTGRSASTPAAVGDDGIHRHVEALRVYRFQRLKLEADADRPRLRRQARQRPVEIAADIAEPIAGAIEADKRREDERRHDDLTLFRDWDVPDAVDKRLAGTPGAVFEWTFLVDHDRQGNRAPGTNSPVD